MAGNSRLLFTFLACSTLLAAQRVITTFTGSDWAFQGDGKPAINAPLGTITGVTLDPSGNLVLVDRDNCMVARVQSNGILSVIAGNTVCNTSIDSSGDGGPSTNAVVLYPFGAGFGPQGSLYIVTRFQVRRISGGIIETIAGTGGPAFAGDGGPALSGSFNFLQGVAADAAGNLYLADSLGYRVRKIGPDGVLSTVAGNGTAGSLGNGGAAISAQLASPQAVAVNKAGILFIADATGIRKVENGIITAVATNISATNVTFDSSGAMYYAGKSSVYKLAPSASTPERIGGNDQLSGFAGDGGPALAALFNGPLTVAADNAGNVYVGDQNNFRVRKISTTGTVVTVAGNGNYRYAGENVAAVTSPANTPTGVIVDAAGNVYFSESGGNRVRRVTKGNVTTVAGSGSAGFSGDGGGATEARLNGPRALALDSGGNLFIADANNSRVRRVTPGGIISTYVVIDQPTGLAFDNNGNLYVSSSSDARVYRVSPDGGKTTFAGIGVRAFSGDTGQAIGAGFINPSGIAVDAAGVVYVADSESIRVRKIALDGIITTIAGNGTFGSNLPASAIGDGGPAEQASLGQPSALTLDAQGALYIATSEGRIRKVAQGIISTVVGRGPVAELGDGKVATEGTLSTPQGISIDTAGNLFIADQFNNRVRVVLASPPTVKLSQSSLSLTAFSGGPPVTKTVSVQGISSGLIDGPLAGLQFSLSVSGGSAWLTVDAAQGATPRLLRITANPATLGQGKYAATITITPLAATPSALTLDVNLEVGPTSPPVLSVDQLSLSFRFPKGSPRRSLSLQVSNSGGGALSFSATASTVTGGSWLTVSPASGTALPGKPVAVTVTADPTSLAVGTYTGSVILQAPGGAKVTVAITATLSSLSQALLLTQTGLSFSAEAGGGILPPQTFGVANPGVGVLDWTASTSTLSGGADWLSISPQAGSSDAARIAPQITVSVNPKGLAPGNYYGLVTVTAPGAANTPQVTTVFLEVLPAGSELPAMIQPTELTFSRLNATTNPGSLTLQLYNISATPKTFRAGKDPGAASFLAVPTEGVLDPLQPVRVTIQPLIATGSYSSTLNFQFSDGNVQRVRFSVVVAPSLPTGAGRQATCTPTTLVPALTSLNESFAVSAGWPVALAVDVRDDCGTPHTSGSVVVSFSDGEPPLSLSPLGDGSWQGTWQTRGTTLSEVGIKVDALNPQAGISGSRELSGSFRSQKDPPVFTQDAVGSAAGFVAYSPVSPGGLISVYGTRLADNIAASKSFPLPTELGNAEVILAGKVLPLTFVSSGQVNAQVPFELNTNTTHQILIRRGVTYSLPVYVDVAMSQPAAFLAGGYAVAVDYRDPAAPFLVSAANPAAAGDTLVIYCTGLGLTDAAVAEGAASPASPPAQTRTPVTVSIGGRNAAIAFAGLTPGFAGLYQINAVVPSGVAPGTAVPLSLSIAGQTGPTSLLAIR